MENKISNIIFRWKNNVLILEANPDLSFKEFICEVECKIKSSGEFFNNTNIKIYIKGLVFTNEEMLVLEKIILNYTNSSIEFLKNFADNEPRTFVSDKIKNKNNILETTYMNAENFTKNDALIHKGTVRAGQCVSSDTNLIIIGDVNPSSEVNASGDIYVLGSLKGVVHAGQNGYRKAVIIALYMLPSQIRIGNVFSRSPNINESVKKPEIAYLDGDTILIKEYSFFDDFKNL